jgi:hypothetical protein
MKYVLLSKLVLKFEMCHCTKTEKEIKVFGLQCVLPAIQKQAHISTASPPIEEERGC